MNQSNQDVSNASGVCAAAVNPDRQEHTPPPYMKLIADCWEHILDYLSFKDMCSLGVTCKRLHRMVTYYLREYFPDAQFTLVGKEVHLGEYDFSFPVEYSRFLSTLCISYDFECDYSLDADTFHSLQTLMFRDIVIRNDNIRCLRDVLKSIEKLDFWCCSFKEEIFERMIDLCRSNLKTLNMDDSDVISAVFLQHYPVLEDFKCITPLRNLCKAIPELKIFLEKHEQLKRFESNHQFLWANRSTLMETNAQLDQLVVHLIEYDNQISLDEFVGFLKKLCERRLFKAVHLLFHDETVEFDFGEFSQQMLPLTPALSALSVLHLNYDSITDLSVLINLNEINFREVHCSEEQLEILAKSLEKLEKLTFDIAHNEQIEPFVRHSRPLKTMKILEYLSDTPINLTQLNQERQQLKNAQPIVIFVEEQFYLWAKWNSKHLNLNMVKISRLVPMEFLPSDY